jgi:hypothetical protein
MFNEEDDERTKSIIAPRSIMIVGMTRALAKRCRDAAAGARVLFVHEADLASLTNLAAERKPLAILFPEHVYAFDSLEFDALARDIQASVVPLGPDISDEELSLRLDDALMRAELLRQPDPPSSRYAVVPETHRRPKR